VQRTKSRRRRLYHSENLTNAFPAAAFPDDVLSARRKIENPQGVVDTDSTPQSFASLNVVKGDPGHPPLDQNIGSIAANQCN
jgi:hypothetical protein